MKPYDICLCMGRFQPFHWGHYDLVQAALAQGERVIVLLGSHLSSQSIKNPWSSGEREMMMRMCLSAADQTRIQVVPICDCETDQEWAATIHRDVDRVAGPRSQIAIVGHHDQGRQFFSQWFSDWAYLERLRRPHLAATDIRLAYFGGCSETHYADKLPPGTLKYLREFKMHPTYEQLCQVSSSPD